MVKDRWNVVVHRIAESLVKEQAFELIVVMPRVASIRSPSSNDSEALECSSKKRDVLVPKQAMICRNCRVSARNRCTRKRSSCDEMEKAACSDIIRRHSLCTKLLWSPKFVLFLQNTMDCLAQSISSFGLSLHVLQSHFVSIWTKAPFFPTVGA